MQGVAETMANGIEIQGFCDEKLLRVREAFAGNFEQDLEVGASLAVTLDGEYVLDLWRGHSDRAKTTLWHRDTIVCVYSTTKIMTALCALILVDRGQLDLDAPVAKYWPEFGQAGKEELPVRYILSHSSGIPGFDEVVPLEALFDWDRTVGSLARQKPWWEPGTASGYHRTFGFLVGELVRRISGVSIGTFFRTEIAEKIGADFHIGLPEEHHRRVAEPVWNVTIPSDLEPDPMAVRWASSPLPGGPGTWASKEYLTAELPSNNGHGNARSVARVGSILAMGGRLDGTRFLPRETIDAALEEQIYVRDHIFGKPVRYGLGLGLPSAEFPLPNPNAFHWGGAGGSFCIMDLDAGICIAYVMNNMLSYLLDDPRNVSIMEALFACMADI